MQTANFLDEKNEINFCNSQLQNPRLGFANSKYLLKVLLLSLRRNKLLIKRL